jgi:hypothetical protein
MTLQSLHYSNNFSKYSNDTALQALCEAAKIQTAANRYAYFRQIANSRLIKAAIRNPKK